MSAKTVLLAEDEQDHRNIITTLLTHHGYRVVEAVDGEEAVRLAREECPDLVLMDAGLPGLDGWEATTRVKNEADTATIPVVIVTVHTQDIDRLRAEASGCDGFIPKPTEPSAILEEVRKRIGPP